jgi:hypothetical protein
VHSTQKTHISINFPVSDDTEHVAILLRPDGRSDSKDSLPEEHLPLFLAFIPFPHRKNSVPQSGHDLLHSAVRADGFVLREEDSWEVRPVEQRRPLRPLQSNSASSVKVRKDVMGSGGQMPSADHRIVAISCCWTLLELMAWSARIVLNL